MAYCKFCGGQLTGQVQYCGQCGKKTDESHTIETSINVAHDIIDLPFSSYVKWVLLGTCVSIVLSILIEGTTGVSRLYSPLDLNFGLYALIRNTVIIVPISCMLMCSFDGGAGKVIKTVLYSFGVSILISVIAVVINLIFSIGTIVGFIGIAPCVGLSLALASKDKDSVKKLVVAGILSGVIATIVYSITYMYADAISHYSADIARFSGNSLDKISRWPVIISQFIHRFISIIMIPSCYKFSMKYIFK